MSLLCPFKNPRREKPRSAVGTNCRRALGLTALLQLFFLCPLFLYYPKYWRCGPNVQHMKAGARHSTCIFPTNSTFTANDFPTEQARGRTPSGGHRQANTSRLGLSQEHKERLYQPQRTTIRILGPVCNMSGMQRRMRLSRYRYTILRLCVYLG